MGQSGVEFVYPSGVVQVGALRHGVGAPLLLKLSVNVTPFGTMILIPRYWSFDHKRDLKWKAVARLHRSRDVHRQGVKLSASQLARYEDGMRALRLWRQARAAGLRELKPRFLH